MKTLITNKRAFVILAVLLASLLVFFSSFKITSKKMEDDAKKEVQEYLDVEMTEETENLGEGLEDEIEAYIEEDISELDITEETETIEEAESKEETEVFEETEEDSSEALPFTGKEYGENELKIGFITDIHAKSNSGKSRDIRIIKEIFKERINYFTEEMNNDFGPDFIVINGDVIEGTGRDEEVGSGELRSVKKLFDKTAIPKYWVLGNHDLRAVDKDTWKKSLEIDYLVKSFDVRNYRIIIMDSNYDKSNNDIRPGEYYTRGNVSAKQIEWLEKELKTDKKKVVFIHHPPIWSVDVRSNSGLPLNALKLQKVFKDNNVTAVFSGHIEDFYFDKIDDVKYFVFPGVVKNEKYQGTFAELNFKDEEVEINVSYIGGNDKYRKINLKEIIE